MVNRLSILGTGKLGLCLALNLERAGYGVTCYDINKDYIEELKNKTFESSEPEVTGLIKHSRDIFFTTDLSIALKNDIIYVVVNTPSTEDNKYDHTNIDAVISEIKKYGKRHRRTDLVLNCTTFPGYINSIQKELNDYNIFVSYNPEFIAQGTIIRDQQYPDAVVIGEADKQAGDLIEKINKDLCKNDPLIHRMSPVDGEITKLAINCFLTTKISYANMVGDIAVRYGGSSSNILSAIGADSRIGSKYLKYGYGFGGPCFPRDNRALAKCAEEVGIDATISKATDIMNTNHLEYQVEEFVKNNDKDKDVIFDFVTYKKESVILEESQQLKFALKLKELGYNIVIKDDRPEVLKQLKNII